MSAVPSKRQSGWVLAISFKVLQKLLHPASLRHRTSQKLAISYRKLLTSWIHWSEVLQLLFPRQTYPLAFLQSRQDMLAVRRVANTGMTRQLYLQLNTFKMRCGTFLVLCYDWHLC
jgi:hypothetical protein